MAKKAGRGSQRPFPGLAGGTKGVGKASGPKRPRNPAPALAGGSRGAPRSTRAAKSAGKPFPGLAGGSASFGSRQRPQPARVGKAPVGR